MSKYKVNDVGLTVDLEFIRILDVITMADNLTFYKVVSADREHQDFMTRTIPESEIKIIWGQARSTLFEIFNPFLENVDEVQDD